MDAEQLAAIRKRAENEYVAPATSLWIFTQAEVRALLDEIDRLKAAIDRVRKLHKPHPETGLGFIENTPEYGDIGQVCGTCGTPQEYGTPWPCATIRALDGGDTDG